MRIQKNNTAKTGLKWAKKRVKTAAETVLMTEKTEVAKAGENAKNQGVRAAETSQNLVK